MPRKGIDSDILSNIPQVEIKCVFAIVNMVNGKRYVGHSSNVKRTIAEYRSKMLRGKFNAKMNPDITAGHTFRIEILQEFPKDETNEQLKAIAGQFSKQFDSELNGYNRKTIYETNTEKSQAYKERHEIQRMGIECRKDSPINKDILQKAADELELPLSVFFLQAAGEFILNKLGAEWLEEQQKDKD